MMLHTVSWLVVFICCGICLCKVGYFGAAHDDFRKLCIILALPGRQNGPDPDTFKATWNTYLNVAAVKLFGTSDANGRMKVANQHCKKQITENDPVCAYRDFVTIGALVEQDVRKLQNTLGTLESTWYYYALYIGAWFQHPQMVRLDCCPTLEHLWVFLAKLSRLESFNLLLHMKTVYDDSHTKGLREEINRICRVSSTKPICNIKIWTDTADKVEKLLNNIGSNKWNNIESEVLKNAMRLHFYALKLQFLKLHPSSAESGFLFTEDSEVKKWIKDTTFYLFNALQQNQIESIGRVVELLPDTVNLPCDYAAEFPSLTRTICTFNSMINSLSSYKFFAGKDTRRNYKQINTHINYETFLQQKRFEQILNIGEITQHSLLIVAKHLKYEMKNNFEELKNYFQNLAQFDWLKSRSDIASINSDLNAYKKKSVDSSKKVDRLMEEILIAALAAVLGDQFEANAIMIFQLADALNPLKTIFGGGAVTDVIVAAQEISQAFANVVKAAVLKKAIDNLIIQIKNFVDKLGENEQYLSTVTILINGLKGDVSLSSFEFEAQKMKFLEDYDNYNPAVTKDDLQEMIVYLENLIDEACDILDSTSGTASGIVKAVLAGRRTCPSAKVEVQKLITIYEEIYDFQFELMDTLAVCMRALTSFHAANVINSDLIAARHKDTDNPDIIAELELLSAFSMICYKISMLTAIDFYCNILEYTEGRLPGECIGAGTSLTSLLGRTKRTCRTSIAFQSIPSKPSKLGDKAYINLKDMYAGETTVFKIPDSQWLIDHNWISPFQRNDKIYIQRFEIYLPVVSKTHTEVQAKVQAIGENQLTPPHGTKYVISPKSPLWYRYREGKDEGSCRQKKITNPYNYECRSMPKICPVSKDSPDGGARANIYPSIYAQWNINIFGYETAHIDVPSTDIHVRVALQLCVLSQPEDAPWRLNGYASQMAKSLYPVRQHVSWEGDHFEALKTEGKCCGSQQYYDQPTSRCTSCPTGSVDIYQGLFCGNLIRLVPSQSNTTTFSLKDAKIACAKAGTTICSTQTMQRAVDLGYDACACGWLSKGTMKAPKPKKSCKENGGLSTITCNKSNTWVVYCNSNY